MAVELRSLAESPSSAVGLDRRVLPVVASATFGTRDYPPFRLDVGPHELTFGVGWRRAA